MLKENQVRHNNYIFFHNFGFNYSKMPIKSESSTPPPRIGKIGPYTVFVTPPTTPNPSSTPSKTDPVRKPAPPPPVMAPPAQFYKEEPSSFAFFWDAVSKLQNAHSNLDEQMAYWFGLNQSKYQWALDDYHESNEKKQKDAKPQTKQGKIQSV